MALARRASRARWSWCGWRMEFRRCVWRAAVSGDAGGGTMAGAAAWATSARPRVPASDQSAEVRVSAGNHVCNDSQARASRGTASRRIRLEGAAINELWNRSAPSRVSIPLIPCPRRAMSRTKILDQCARASAASTARLAVRQLQEFSSTLRALRRVLRTDQLLSVGIEAESMASADTAATPSAASAIASRSQFTFGNHTAVEPSLNVTADVGKRRRRSHRPVEQAPVRGPPTCSRRSSSEQAETVPVLTLT